MADRQNPDKNCQGNPAFLINFAVIRQEYILLHDYLYNNRAGKYCLTGSGLRETHHGHLTFLSRQPLLVYQP
jgi:hypothetical protein